MPTLWTPAIRLALNAARARQARLIQRFEASAAAALVTTPPTPTKTGRGKPFLRRDPTVDRREGRNWEILVEVLNSLFVQGFIYEQSKGVWAISGGGVAGLTGTFTDSF